MYCVSYLLIAAAAAAVAMSYVDVALKFSSIESDFRVQFAAFAHS